MKYQGIVCLFAFVFTLATSGVMDAVPATRVYLPMASQPVGAPVPPPSIVELTPIDSPIYLYGAVQPSTVVDKTGLLWIALYCVRDGVCRDEPGSYLATYRPGDTALRIVSGRLGTGPRGALVVACDQKLYYLGYDESSHYVLIIYRINSFPGPATPMVCDGAATQRLQRGDSVQ